MNYEDKLKLDEEFFEERDSQFGKFCAGSLTIFKIKNRQYNDAISRTGLLGAVVEIVGVAARLEPLIIQDRNFDLRMEDDLHKREAVLNVLHDLHNYATIALMMLEDENWRGE